MKKKVLALMLAFMLAIPMLSGCGSKQEELNIYTWEDYVPEKYYNPKTEYSRGGAIALIAVGVELTALIITSPIGIPMICNGSTKFKHVSYSARKAKFQAGLEEAEKIQDPLEKQKFYTKLLQECKLKEKNKEKNIRRSAKAKAKAEKKAQKEAEKQQKKLEKVKK